MQRTSICGQNNQSSELMIWPLWNYEHRALNQLISSAGDKGGESNSEMESRGFAAADYNTGIIIYY